MNRGLFAVGVALGVSCVVSPASADNGSGLALGLRVGYGIPMGDTGGVTGKESSNVALHDVVSGMVPLWFDVGYRFTPALYAGAFFQYGFAFVNDQRNAECKQGVSCSAHDIAFGANLHYHALPQGIFDPWLGAGFGYEVLTVNESGTSTSLGTSLPVERSWKAKGFQFLILEAGGDFKATPDLAVGPFVNFALGQYSGWSNHQTIDGMPEDQSGDLPGATHEWLTLGVRGQYNL